MYFEAGHTYPLEDNQMCAGYKEGGKDSCQVSMEDADKITLNLFLVKNSIL